jgi:hypothetical protein
MPLPSLSLENLPTINIQALSLKSRILQWCSTPCHQRNHHQLQEVNQRSPAQRSVTQGNEQRTPSLGARMYWHHQRHYHHLILLHADICNIPSNRTVAYAHIVIDHCPQKEDPNHVCITVRGNLINYLFELTSRTADIVSSKILWNSVISTKDAHFASANSKNMYLETPLD